MTLNKDGLEPGQPVDFETMMRVNRQRKVQEDEPEPTKQRGRPKKKGLHRSDEPELQDSSESAVSKEA